MDSDRAAKRRWYRRPVVRYCGLCVALTVSLAGVYIVDTIQIGGQRSAAQQPANSSAPQVLCTASEASFCDTERAFRTFVAAGDFSSILERQEATTAVCGNVQVRSYCTSAQAGLSVRLLAITESGVPTLVTRNGYIAYFRAYFAANDPLTYIADIPDGDKVTMHFQGEHAAYYDLLFQKVDGSWRLVAPSTGTRLAGP